MTTTSTRPKPRVLIVDESTISNRVMVLALQMHGFPSLAVTNEADAMKSIDEFEPDVVILEWAHRIERRVEEAARLRSHSEASGRALAVIVVTHESNSPSLKVLDTVDGYFTKPVVLPSLEETILRVGHRQAR